MADHSFYTGVYLGDSIPEAEFPRLAQRAARQLARYEHIYQVKGTQEDRDRAVCAMADALYYFETVQNTPQSASIGSVSSSQGAVDVSPGALSRELYRCACLYLEVHRGCGPC